MVNSPGDVFAVVMLAMQSTIVNTLGRPTALYPHPTTPKHSGWCSTFFRGCTGLHVDQSALLLKQANDRSVRAEYRRKNICLLRELAIDTVVKDQTHERQGKARSFPLEAKIGL
jgi:hypothetical protein